MKEMMESINKYGVLPVAVLLLFWQNRRLDIIEARLFDCFEDRIEARISTGSLRVPFINRNQHSAILPTNPVGSIHEENDNEDIC